MQFTLGTYVQWQLDELRLAINFSKVWVYYQDRGGDHVVSNNIYISIHQYYIFILIQHSI